MKKRSAELARSLHISYPRSDGRLQVLTLEEILKRKEAFEMGYNPNDCPEIRWGAPPGSEEMSSCRRRAPAGQRAKMEQPGSGSKNAFILPPDPRKIFIDFGFLLWHH